MQYTFEWDAEKARLNFQKHGVTFEEATTAFSDPLSRTMGDPDHSDSEDRYLLLGLSNRGRLLVVAHTDAAIESASSQQGSRPSARSDSMKKAKRKQSTDDLRPEYDFSKAVRGKYAGRIARKATVVLLEPDVAKVFPSSESVNTALRALVEIARPKKRKKAG